MKENVPAPETRAVKTPPFLLLAALLFWGWQSGLLLVGAAMGIVLESARFLKARWELSDADFRRILTFCTVLVLATAVYAFTANEEGGSLGGLFHGPGAAQNASVTGVRASNAFFRWLPMTLFLFMLAQSFSAREKIPWTAISFYSLRRAQRERKSARIPPSGVGLNISYPYFMVCLFSAGIHPNTLGTSFFWGQCALTVWALWPFRSRRCGIAVWAGALAAVIVSWLFQPKRPRDVRAGPRRLQPPMVRAVPAAKSRPDANAQRPSARLADWNCPAGSSSACGPTTTNRRQIICAKPAIAPIILPRQSWYAGTSRNDFGNISAETNQTTWILLPGKTNAVLGQPRLLPGWRQGVAAVADGQWPAGKSLRLRPPGKQ